MDLTGAYDGEIQDFGPQYFLPKPFDHRLSVHLPLAVARAAVETGQAPVFDLDHYLSCLMGRAYKDFLLFKTLLARSTSSDHDAPGLGYRIETDSGRIPHAVCAAARLLKSLGLINPFFIGHSDIIRDQIKHDSVLSNIPVYSVSDEQQGVLSQVMGQQACRVISVVSSSTGAHEMPHQTPHHHNHHLSGWVYGGKLHLYSHSSPTDQIKALLETCGCRLLAGFDGHPPETGDYNALRPRDSGAGAFAVSFDASAPQFGGLAAPNRMDAVWHIGASLEGLDKPWFGPFPLVSAVVLSEDCDVRYATESSCWTLLMQETCV